MVLPEGPETTESSSRHAFALKESPDTDPTIAARIDAVVSEVENRREKSMFALELGTEA
jgi:hypothetical protein